MLNVLKFEFKILFIYYDDDITNTLGDVKFVSVQVLKEEGWLR